MVSKLMEQIKKAFFLTSNLRLWLVSLVFGVFIIVLALFIGFLPYINRISAFLMKKFLLLTSFDASLRGLLAFAFFLIAFVVIVFSAYKIYKFFANANDGLFENVYRDSKLSKGKKIVTIGGGTGQYTLLNGLKEYTTNITAIVTTMDNGSSSQLLKTEFGILPPGDIRNCMVALSPLSDDLRNIFSKRFSPNSSLKGHPIGNLILTKIAQDEGFPEALRKVSKLLQLRGSVLPVTYDKAELIAVTEKGIKAYGEEEVTKKGLNIKEIFLNETPKANPDVLKAISDADIIVLGPGSLFTSIIPNLLVPGVANAIKKSKAKKVYVMQVMTQYAETHGFKAENFISWLSKYVNLDYVLMNTTKPSKEKLNAYAKENKFFVDSAEGNIKNSDNNNMYMRADLVDERVVLRHDSKKLAQAIYNLK